eukprot:12967244-Alexandrium_andersonii.AAC.1
MSASLVGSEMCIRDSLKRLRVGMPERAGPPTPIVSLALAGSAAPPTPVSYTHLTLPTICSV